MKQGAPGIGQFLLERTSRSLGLSAGAFVGAFVMLSIFGPRFMLGTSPYWEYPRGDAKVYVMGYERFVHEPWGSPIGVIQSVAPPEGLSLTFTDSIPVMALPAKAIAPIVPSVLRPTFDRPYGLWLLLVFTLQGIMAARFNRRLGFGSIASSALTAAFVCTLPAFLVRFGHEALDSHFFLLWALLLVVVVRAEPPRWRHAAEWTVLFLLVTLVHPYLLAMCAALWLAWCVTALVTHRRKGKVALLTLLGAPAAVAGAMSVLGLLRLQTMNGRAVGFGAASFNPASLVVSRFSVLTALVDPRVADATGFQYEGQDYLGIGLFSVILVALVMCRREFGASLRRHRFLVVVFVAFFVFALSNRVFVGKTLLFSYPLPERLVPIATQFRSSGRFIWVPTYALVLWAIAQLARRERAGALLLSATLLLQFIDVRAYAAWMRGVTSEPDTKRLDWRVWNELVAKHDAVWTYPHYECMGFFREADDFVSRGEISEVSFLSAMQHRVVSSMFSPREHRVCVDEATERESIVPRDGTLYVLFRRVASGRALVRLERQGARCLAFDGGYACSTRSLALPAPAPAPPPYALGTWVSFREGTDSVPHQGPGWAASDATGRWAGNITEGRTTSFHYVVGGPRPPSYVFEVEVDGGNYAASKSTVRINDRDVGTLEVEPHAERQHARFCVPSDVPGIDRWIVVDLVPRDPAAPAVSELHVRMARLSAEECP